MPFARLAYGAVLALALSFPASAAERTVMVMQALTGPGAFAGVQFADGIKYAVSELNAQKFLGEDQIKLVIVDSATDRGQSVTAATRAANDPQFLAIIGPTTPMEAIPASAVANDLKIPLLAMTLAEGVRKAGPWSFTGPQSSGFTMPKLAQFVAEKLKAKTCAMTYSSDNESYVDFARIVQESAEKLGLKIGPVGVYKTSEDDYSAFATSVAAAKPDCVLLFAHAPQSANMAIQLRNAGVPESTVLVGQQGLASPALMEIGGKSVEGLVFNANWIPGGSNDLGRAFAAGFKKETGNEPGDFTALGHSYMRVLAHAIKAAGPEPTREKIRAALTATKNVPVVVGEGLYSLDENRVATYGVSFIKIKDGKFVNAE